MYFGIFKLWLITEWRHFVTYLWNDPRILCTGVQMSDGRAPQYLIDYNDAMLPTARWASWKSLFFRPSEPKLSSTYTTHIITEGDVKLNSGILQLKSYVENQLKQNKLKNNMTRRRDRTANLKRSRRELSHCASTQLAGSGLKRWYKLWQVIVYVRAWLVVGRIAIWGMSYATVGRIDTLVIQ